MHIDTLRTQPMLRAINSNTESVTGTKMKACIFISSRGKTEWDWKRKGKEEWEKRLNRFAL